MATMDEIDYKIYGDDMQFVEVERIPWKRPSRSRAA